MNKDTYSKYTEIDLISMEIQGDGREYYMYSSKYPLTSMVEVNRISTHEWEVHRTVDGWVSAVLNLQDTIKYIIGELPPEKINWT